MNCRKARHFLFSYFKNELSESEKAEIKLHLEDCPDCTRESIEVERTCLLIKDSLETLTPSPDFNQKLFFRIQKLSLEKTKEVKSPSNFSLLTYHFPLRIKWALAGSLAVMILASVLWFTHKPTPIKPEAISEESKKSEVGSGGTEGLELVNQGDREDSLYREMLKELANKSRFRTKTFVLDNFERVGTRGIDGTEKPEDMYKRFIIETAGHGAEARRVGNYYVLPAVSIQQTSEKVNY
jgi:hypothetical protein